jgi:hypothetical protein
MSEPTAKSEEFELKSSFADAEAEWRGLIEPLLPIGRRLVSAMKDPSDRQLRFELYRSVFSALATGIIVAQNTDSEYPEFVPFCGYHQLNVLGPNPDWIYSMCPVDDAGIYQISGMLEHTFRTMVQIGGGTFVTQGNGMNIGRTLANYTVDDLSIEENGAFSVILSAERPDGYDGDWWHLPDGATYIVPRSFGLEWLDRDISSVVDSRLAIERIDRPASKPRAKMEEIEASLSALGTWAEGYVSMSMQWAQRFRDLGVNEMHLIEFSEDGGMPTQAYFEGQWEMAEDEAILIETVVPKECEYWSFHVLDENWAALDYSRRRTHINNTIGVIDPDGMFRAIISPEDPGIPNWLDSMGYSRGLIQGRWHNASDYPQPSLRIVKRSQLAEFWRSNQATVTSERREIELRRTNRALQLRRRW